MLVIEGYETEIVKLSGIWEKTLECMLKIQKV